MFNPVHNVQPRTPVENLIAMFEAYWESRDGCGKTTAGQHDAPAGRAAKPTA